MEFKKERCFKTAPLPFQGQKRRFVGSNYMFFTSNKSSLIDLCEWFEDNRHVGNPFKNSVLNTQNVTINSSKNRKAGYTDMMLYKFVK